MGLADMRRNITRSAASEDIVEMSPVQTDAYHDAGGRDDVSKAATTSQAEAGVSNIEAAQSIWGKTGFRLVCLG